MTYRIKYTLAGLLASATLGYAQVSSETGSDNVDEENVFELSPFTVEDAQDSGYAATSTLAGSRVRSDIKDLGASISITTKDFLTDTGATDGESLLMMIGNVEVGGVLGNFSGSGDGVSTNGVRNNPQTGQRVRGLSSASTTRDYFQTNVPFDAYNTSRVEVNRGPNSILFGLGSPGGIINNSTNVAKMNNRSGEVGFRVDAEGGHRATFDFNETLVKDRLAVRVNALTEQINYKQKPAFESDDRIFGAFELVLRKDNKDSWLGRTAIRGSYESGEIDRNPPDTIPPTDGFSSWFYGLGGKDRLRDALAVPGTDLSNISNGAVAYGWIIDGINEGWITVPPGQTAEKYASAEGQFIPGTTVDRFNRNNATNGRQNTQNTIPYFLFPAINYNSPVAGTIPGWTDPDLSNVQGIMGRWRRNGRPTQDVFWSSPATAGPGFRAPSLQNRDIFDYHNNLFQGTTNSVITEFDVAQVYLEQGFFDNKVGLEFAWNEQSRTQSRFNAFSSGSSKTIFLEITENHAPGDQNWDGTPDRLYNENLLRPVIRWDDNTYTVQETDQETTRATLFAILDTQDFGDNWLTKVLGSHTFTGLYEDRTVDNYQLQTRGSWWADNSKYPGSGDISSGDSDNFRRIVKSQIFLGDSVARLTDPSQMRLNLNGGVQVPVPQIGEEYGIWYFDNNNSIDDGRIHTWRIIENIQGGDISRFNLESTAVSVQSRMFWDNIVAMYAIREDEQTSWRRIQQTAATGPTGSTALRISDPGNNETDGNFNMALLELEDAPFAVDKGDTTTWSVVAKYPESWLGDLPFGMDLQGHYYEAESFQPASGQVNIFNEPLTSPLGTTKEWGATLDLLDGRLSIRYNNFETINANSRTNLGGALGNIVGRIGNFTLGRIAEAENGGLSLFPSPEDALLTTTTNPSNRQRLTGTDADLIGVNSFDEYYARIIAILPPEVQSVYNFRTTRDPNSGLVTTFSDPLDGSLQSTRDFVATGHEIDVVGKLTKNISVSFNVAQQATVTSNTGPVAIPLAFEIMDSIKAKGFYDIRDSPFQRETGAVGASRYEGELRTLRTQKALDGTKSPEQREWRWNLTGRYDFNEGRLRGLSVGGTLRYQSGVAAGYPNLLDEFGNVIPDIANPWEGPDSLNGDMFVRYRTKLTDKIGWSIQLNARNLYRKNGSEDIPTFINPDGNVAQIRIPVEQQFFLTNTFSF